MAELASHGQLRLSLFRWALVLVPGILLLGMLSAMALSSHALALLGTGFCGGFTTYSAFAVHTHALGLRRGTAYAAATIGVSLAACAVGHSLYA